MPSAHLPAAKKSEWERNQERLGKGGSPRDPLVAPFGLTLPRQCVPGADGSGRSWSSVAGLASGARAEGGAGEGGRWRLDASASGGTTWSSRAGRRAPAGLSATARSSGSRIVAASAAAAAAAARAGPNRVPSAARSAPASLWRAGSAPARAQARAHTHSLTHSHTCALSAPEPRLLLLSAPQWKAGPNRSFFKYLNYRPASLGGPPHSAPGAPPASSPAASPGTFSSLPFWPEEPSSDPPLRTRN